MLIFIILYIISALSIYTLIFGAYERKKTVRETNIPNLMQLYNDRWEETSIRYKHPLWMLLGAILLALIPVANLIVPLIMFIDYNINDRREYYYKTFLNEKY